jgi:adenine-specific DNA methylase
MKLIKNASSDKLRGGYYTPYPIASFILRWGMHGNEHSKILEPSCGDGVFLDQLKKINSPYESITAVELDSTEIKKASKIQLPKKKIINKDFYHYCNTTKDRFDLIIGNPPYIRYQYFSKEQHEMAKKIFMKAGLHYTKLSNSWVSFVVGACLLLKETGKIGFVLPAELLQVSYARGLREYLSRFFNKINIISFKKLVFSSIQQEVLLLLCEKNGKNTHCIEHIEIKDAADLDNLNVSRLKTARKKIDIKNNKWTYYFLEQKEIDFLNQLSKKDIFSRIDSYANVEVGITTGANNYFTVPYSIVEKYNLKKYAKPMVGRSVQIAGLDFTENDWKANLGKNIKANLLVFPSKEYLKDNMGALAYIDLGENNGINNGYKTGIRDDWFVIPSIKLSDAFFIRRNHTYPRMILNSANAYTTDTMHRVFIKKNINKKAFVASYYNSLSFAFSEIVGRSYGGGVLELMPGETENIFLPYNLDHDDLFDEIDAMMRKKINVDEILEISNKILLHDGLGLSAGEIRIADNIWKKLSSRRLNRKQV